MGMWRSLRLKKCEDEAYRALSSPIVRGEIVLDAAFEIWVRGIFNDLAAFKVKRWVGTRSALWVRGIFNHFAAFKVEQQVVPVQNICSICVLI